MSLRHSSSSPNLTKTLRKHERPVAQEFALAKAKELSESLKQQFELVDAIMALDTAASQLRHTGSTEVSMPGLLAKLPGTGPRHSASVGSSRASVDVTSPKGNVRRKRLYTSSTVLPSLPGAAPCATEQHCSSQSAALNALFRSMDTGKPLAELLFRVVRHVLTYRGEKTFTLAGCEGVMASVCVRKGLEQEPSSTDSVTHRIHLLVEALQDCAEQIKVPLDDIVGQIFWQYRSSPALQKKKHRDAAVDLSWLKLGRMQHTSKLAIDVFFEKVSAGNQVMDSKGWQQVVRLVAKCKTLSGHVNRADADRLWLSHVQCDPMRKAQGGLNKLDFKMLLLSLSELMEVHPWMVFYTLEGHAYNGTSMYITNKLGLTTPTTSGQSTPIMRSRSNSLVSSSTTSPSSSRPLSSSASRATSESD